ncbi:hypothetical protein Tco_1164039 [Tanacetum coccineum]
MLFVDPRSPASPTCSLNQRQRQAQIRVESEELRHSYLPELLNCLSFKAIALLNRLSYGVAMTSQKATALLKCRATA